MMLLRPLRLLTLAGLLLSAACSPSGPADLTATRAGTMPPVLVETSGLAASRRADDQLWAHNDSGGEPVLYAVDLTGRLRGTLRLTGAVNTDWEDIAAFELDGRAWLLAADTGDNTGRRHDCSLLIVPEPDPATLSPAHELATPVAWRVPVRFPDGPHDCEAVAVDAPNGLVYLVTKRTVPAWLYSLPLRPASGDLAILTATRIAALRQIAPEREHPSGVQLPSFVYHEQATGMDFAPDGSAAAVLTYGSGWLFPRHAGQTWTAAFAGTPVRIAFTGLTQAEGVCFSRDSRTLFITSEGKNAPLLRCDLPAMKP